VIFGATQVFIELQDDLDIIWGVQPHPTKVKGMLAVVIRSRLFSFGMVLVIGFLLLVSLLLSAFLEGVGRYVVNLSSSIAWLFQIVNFLGSFAVITFLFAAILKILPDIKLDECRILSRDALIFPGGATSLPTAQPRCSLASSHPCWRSWH
jgi:membrane protein